MMHWMWAWTLAGPWLWVLALAQAVSAVAHGFCLLRGWDHHERRARILVHACLVAQVLVLLWKGAQGQAGTQAFRGLLVGAGTGLLVRLSDRFAPSPLRLWKVHLLGFAGTLWGVWRGFEPGSRPATWDEILVVLALIWASVAVVQAADQAVRWLRTAFLMLTAHLMVQAWISSAPLGIPLGSWPVAGAWLLQAAALHLRHGHAERFSRASLLAWLALLGAYARVD